jgi:hypothetical protein
MKTDMRCRLSLATLVGVSLLQLQMLCAQNTTLLRAVIGGEVREQTITHRGMNPAPDTDGDGYEDDQERALGTDPADPGSKGASEPTLLSRITTTSYRERATLPAPGLPGFQAGTTTNYLQLVVRQTVTEEVPPDLPAAAWTPSPDLGTRTFSAEYDPSAPERWRISGQRIRLDNFPDPGLISTFDMTRSWHSPANPPAGAVSDTLLRVNAQYVAHPAFLDSVDVIIRVEKELTLSKPGAPVEVPPGLFSETSSWIAGPVRAHRSGSNETAVDYVVAVPAGTAGVIRWLEVFTPSDGTAAQVTARAWTVGAGETKSPAFTLSCPADGQADVWLTPGALLVDSSRDGVIALPGDEGVAPDPNSAAQPFRFWINDDADGGSIGIADIPSQVVSSGTSGIPHGADYRTSADFSGVDIGHVQGARDLVDYFPVFLDIRQLLTAFPPSASSRFKLKQADGAMNFVYTNLTRDRAFDYQRPPANATPLTTGFGVNLTQAPGAAVKFRISAQGFDLFGSSPAGSPAFLDAIQNHNGGVILVEGRAATTAPLVLSVEKDGIVMIELKLETKIVPVETMFRHLNLHDRNLPGLVGSMPGGVAQPEAMGDPSGFPDNPNSDSRWLIFVHGFNVNGQASRGWNAEMFKRCYWSGSNARFVGVSWFGNPDQVFGAISDYHLSVRNAMVTAPVLAQEINGLPGGAEAKTLFAHSLGCGVLSSAIADHGMTVGRACFVDAAVARECFDGRDPNVYTSENDGMTPAAWKTYNPSLYAANWFARFDPETDARGQLTWRNRFSGASPVVYNFYSSTEDVLAEYQGELPTSIIGVLSADGPIGAFGWVYQEKGKGNRQNYLSVGVAEVTHLGSYYGGWGFNLNDPLTANLPKWYIPDIERQRRVVKTPDQIGLVSTAILSGSRFNPLFKTGWGRYDGAQPERELIDTNPTFNDGPTWILDLYGTTSGNIVAANSGNRAQLLAEAIPSLTWCMGSREVTRFEDRNFNIPSLVNQINWPRGKPDGTTPEWRHSDMREVAYLYQYDFFDKIVELSKP